MPWPITTKAIPPKSRNNVAWKVFTQAVPRIPPKNT